MSDDRCYCCGNLARFCICNGAGNIPVPPPEPLPYEAALARIKADLMEFTDRDPTPEEFVVVALGGNPTDTLWLCRNGCGVTTDDECDFGGWHGYQGHNSVELTVTTADG